MLERQGRGAWTTVVFQLNVLSIFFSWIFLTGVLSHSSESTVCTFQIGFSDFLLRDLARFTCIKSVHLLGPRGLGSEPNAELDITNVLYKCTIIVYFFIFTPSS